MAFSLFKSDEDRLIERLQNGGSLDAMDEDSVGYGASTYTNPSNTLTLSQRLSGLGDSLSSFNIFGNGSGSGSGNILSDIWKWGSSPMGTGKNATTPFELLIPALTAGYGIYSQNKQFKQGYNLAKQQADNQMDLARFNALQNGTILGANLLDQAQGRTEFNPNSAAPYVNTASDAMNQIADAGQKIGIDRSSWNRTLQGFNTLRNSLA